MTLFTPVLRAQDYLGATTVIEQLNEAAKATAKPAEQSDSPVDKLKAAIAKYNEEAAKLPPQEAAQKWWSLLNEYIALVKSSPELGYNSDLSTARIVEVLPPSSAWDHLVKIVEQQTSQEQTLAARLMGLAGTLLQTDAVKRQAALKALENQVSKIKGLESYEKRQLEELVARIQQELVKRVGTDAEKVALFKESLEQAQKPDPERGNYPADISIPKALTSLPPAEAKKLLHAAIKTNAVLEPEGKAIRALLVEVIEEHINDLKIAQWGLVDQVEAGPLYELMLKKFSTPMGNEAAVSWDTAQNYYLIYLIVKNRPEDATKQLMSSISRDQLQSLNNHSFMVQELQQAGHGKKVIAFLESVLKQEPSLPLWSDYIQLSAQESVSPAALAFMEATLKRPDLSPAARQEIQPKYYEALLAADRVDEGVQMLRSLVAAGGAGEKTDALSLLKQQHEKLGLPFNADTLQSDTSKHRHSSPDNTYAQQCAKLIEIGQLLKDQALIDDGIKHFRAHLEQSNPKEDSSSFNRLANLLVKLDRGAEAEPLYLTVLKARVQALKEQQSGRGDQPSFDLSSELTDLLELYHQTKRYQDVLTLLQDSPMWGSDDLQHVRSYSANEPLAYIAAHALAKTGRTADAQKMLPFLLEKYSGNDRVYELLLDIGGDQIISLLDQAAKADRFQERPYIWKAKIQFDAGKIDEAEKTIREAIAIDPSDGEQGKGDRMRAYAVLGDILEKKGDAAQAKIMRGAVSAIRLSEDADDWWSAGLLMRAVKMYEKSLTLFADAYCIQSRLALRYSEMGDFAKAEEHYLRAYELMPDSFGRIESHCFGCEGAFRGPRAQNIADKVFTKLATEQPNKAQVFYLLGYLRSSQDRMPEAAQNYRKAVELDPDYFNAWQKLSNISDDDAPMSDDERDQIALAIFRLEPVTKRGSSLSLMKDVRKLWDTILEAEATGSKPLVVTSLYPLPASAAVLSQQQSQYRYMRSQNTANENNLRSQLRSNSVMEIFIALTEYGARMPR